MTDQQEIILDKLVGAEHIGHFWARGQLRLAVEALGLCGLTKSNYEQTALGFPRPFCAGVAAASETLNNLENVRTLAIALFSDISPLPEPLLLDEGDLCRVVIWCARFIHLNCDRKNSLCDEVAEILDTYDSAEQLPTSFEIQELNARFDRAFDLITVDSEFDERYLLLSVFFFALHTIRQVEEEKSASDNAERTCRAAGRLAGLSLGLDGAAPFCLGLAAEMGLR